MQACSYLWSLWAAWPQLKISSENLLQSEAQHWGLARWHPFTRTQNSCVLQPFSSLLPFPPMHVHFQLITPCVIMILQGRHTTQLSRRTRAEHVKSTPELLPLTQYPTLWSLLTVHKSLLRLLCRYYGERTLNLCLKPGLWKHSALILLNAL